MKTWKAQLRYTVEVPQAERDRMGNDWQTMRDAMCVAANVYATYLASFRAMPERVSRVSCEVMVEIDVPGAPADQAAAQLAAVRVVNDIRKAARGFNALMKDLMSDSPRVSYPADAADDAALSLCCDYVWEVTS